MNNLFFNTIILSVTCFSFAQETIVKHDNESTLNATTFEESKDTYSLLPTGVNSRYSDIGSAFFMNKYVMYSSRKTGAIGAGKDLATNEPFNTLYCISIDKSGNLSKPYFFANILDGKGNEGGLTFSKDQKIIYYTKSTVENSKNYQLYKSIFDEECKCKWIEEAQVDFNSSDYSIENPNVSADGKKMYFSSNMPGGFGGYDIYVADINDKGMPINPKNLGDVINTAQDEKFPCGAPNKEFYFSSNGHKGYGKQDVFVSKLYKKGFTDPVNLGRTINTPEDEVSFTLASRTRGYLSSNREGSLGSFDIFKFDLQKTAIKIKGFVTEKLSKTLLPNTIVTLIDEDGIVLGEQMSGENGSFTFEVDPLESYEIVAKKDGYTEFSLPKRLNKKDPTILELDQTKAIITETALIVENIYFDYGKASLKKESTLSLNKIYDVLMVKPDMKIIINAHTDARGSDKYNLMLSQKRAAEARTYLLKKGIAQDRVEANGYGESKPLSDCNSNCTEEQYIAERRVEFIIK
jgi:outer membrane protein OmpA-like peptidoglycan-associated protein